MKPFVGGANSFNAATCFYSDAFAEMTDFSRCALSDSVPEELALLVGDQTCFAWGHPRVASEHKSMKHVPPFSYKGDSVVFDDNHCRSLVGMASPFSLSTIGRQGFNSVLEQSEGTRSRQRKSSISKSRAEQMLSIRIVDILHTPLTVHDKGAVFDDGFSNASVGVEQDHLLVDRLVAPQRAA